MQLSSEERIKRIEMAPAEIQIRVAKAFLRDDIDDEDVQYLFNTDSIEVLNDPNDNAIIENINADAPEGIGAGKFFIRNYKPSGNKNFITTGSGGWNTCIKGYPMDPNANVLANCVGYASGRFNEIINEARGTIGCTYKYLNCNAEWFIERAKQAGLQIGSTPRVGAIMCWQKGTVDGGQDGAGHVAIVERVYSDSSVYTSESGYGSTAFWNQNRSNSNGRWGIGSGYSFRGFIYLPDDVQKIVDGGSQPTPGSDPFPGVSDEELARRVWTGEFGNGDDRKNRLGSRYAAVQALVNRGIGKPSTPVPAPKPVVTNTLHVGDTVKIIGTGNGSSYGTSGTAYGIGWTRTVLKIWEGRQYPYQIGNNTGTTGFYKAEALQKK